MLSFSEKKPTESSEYTCRGAPSAREPGAVTSLFRSGSMRAVEGQQECAQIREPHRVAVPGRDGVVHGWVAPVGVLCVHDRHPRREQRRASSITRERRRAAGPVQATFSMECRTEKKLECRRWLVGPTCRLGILRNGVMILCHVITYRRPPC